MPLTTKVMYDGVGRELDVRRLGFASEGHGEWVAFCAVPPNEIANPYDLDELHLRRPDSWERLEEDVKRFGNDGSACEYFCNELRSCDGCRSPSHIGFNCRNGVACDVLSRAKVLAGRDAKGAEQ